MRKAAPGALLLLSLVAVLPLTGCQKMRARVEMKQGNEHYKKENYREALAQFQKGLEMDPSATFVWRSVGLSAMALYRPDSDDPQNAKYGQLAIDAFQKYLRSFPTDEKVQDYLMTTYLNTERYQDALNFLKAEQAKKPTDKTIDSGIVSVLIKQDKLEEAYQWATTHPSKTEPTVFYSIGVVAWDKAYRSPDPDPVRQQAIIDFGLKCLNDALRLKPDYADAMVYKGLLLRQWEKLVDDPLRKLELAAEAQALRDKAIELKKKADAEAAKTAAAAGS